MTSLESLGYSPPRHNFCELPTPLYELSGSPLSGAWIKDDSLSAEAYGGNKARKLEYLLADAERAGADTLHTVGAIGSHHALATAVHGTRLGFRVKVLHFPQASNEHVLENLWALTQCGAELELCDGIPSFLARMTQVKLECALPSSSTYFVPGGGTSPLGTLGYVNAGLELSDQLQRAGATPTRIYCAAGTGGTLIGIVLGLALAGLSNIDVHGVRVTDRVVMNRATMKTLLERCLRLLPPRLQERASVNMPRWELRQEFFGAGYALPQADAERAKATAMAMGLRLDSTYTAKAFAAMLLDVESGRASAEQCLYWHTLNGQPLAALAQAPFAASSLPSPYQTWLKAQP